jgi:hypothetical protein
MRVPIAFWCGHGEDNSAGFVCLYARGAIDNSVSGG